MLRVMTLEGLSSVDTDYGLSVMKPINHLHSGVLKPKGPSLPACQMLWNDVIKCCPEIQEQHLHVSVLYLKVQKTQVKRKGDGVHSEVVWLVGKLEGLNVSGR